MARGNDDLCNPVGGGKARADAKAPGIGHNGGPQLYQGYKTWRWKKAHKQAWRNPPREVMLRRLKRAKELGMSYHDYTLEIMERGRYL